MLQDCLVQLKLALKVRSDTPDLDNQMQAQMLMSKFAVNGENKIRALQCSVVLALES